jgi:hypothetical protein
MRQYLTAIVVAIALCAGIAYSAEQQSHAEYVQAQRGSHE